MDYTLAEYRTPDLEESAFKCALERLIQLGYPSAISDFQYDSKFPGNLYSNLKWMEIEFNFCCCFNSI